MEHQAMGEGHQATRGWREENTLLVVTCFLLCLVFCLLLTACATGKKRSVFEMTDEELLAHGRHAYEKKRYEDARQALSRITSEPFRAEAILLRGHTYFDQKGMVHVTQALPLYENFILFYPRHEKVPMALYRIGEIHFRQYEAPDRDLTHTAQALEEFKRLVKRFPDSDYASQARTKIVECRRRFAEHEFLVGKFYVKRRSYEGAWDRFQRVLGEYNGILETPELFYYLVRTAWNLGKAEQAKTYYLELQDRFPDSKYVQKADRVLAKPPKSEKGT